MGAKLRIAHAAVLCSITLAAVLPGQAQQTYEIGICHDTAACARRDNTEQQRAAMIAEQVAKFQCVPAGKGQIPGRALIRDTHQVAGVGMVADGVVRAVSFDAAFAGAKAGRAWIVRWCR